MPQQTIKIDGMQPKTAKTGTKYTSFHTSIGEIGVFEEDVVADLSKHMGEHVVVEIAIRPNGYKNIIKYIGPGDANNATTAPTGETNSTVEQAVKEVLVKIVDEKVQNSVEFGATGERIKLYFGSEVKPFDLQNKVAEYMTAVRAGMQSVNQDKD